jgi:hypothetical protein
MECAPKVTFATDSALEGDGFELPVPGRETVKSVMGDAAAVSKTGPDLLRNLRFESISLQRRVTSELCNSGAHATRAYMSYLRRRGRN